MSAVSQIAKTQMRGIGWFRETLGYDHPGNGEERLRTRSTEEKRIGVIELLTPERRLATA
jgi:hypothetical protein